jgi:aryl-alcohol dehydrogenase-like predicted oxidoreductase
MKPISRREFVGSSAALAGASLLGPLAGRLLEAAPALQKRPLGKTGFDATIVGFGGGSRFYQPEYGDENAAAFLKHMIDRGVNLVETSANYGPNGESEKRIGLAMKTHRSKVFLETKVDTRDYDGAMREMERSLQRMNTDRLDLVLHHNLSNQNQLDQVAGPTGAERAIRKMIEQKAVRFRGFSSHVPAFAVEAIKRLEPDAIQLIINATRVPDMEAEVLPLARARNIGVIAMKTCGHGYFFKSWATRPDRIDQFGPPPGTVDRPGLPTPRDYLHYALSLPIAVAVVGIDAMSTADSVVDTALAFKPMPAAEMKSVTERCQVFATTGYWVRPPRTGTDDAD